MPFLINVLLDNHKSDLREEEIENIIKQKQIQPISFELETYEESQQKIIKLFEANRLFKVVNSNTLIATIKGEVMSFIRFSKKIDAPLIVELYLVEPQAENHLRQLITYLINN